MYDSAAPRTVAHQAPLSVGILQARILQWVAMPSSRVSSQPMDQTLVSCIGRWILYNKHTHEYILKKSIHLNTNLNYFPT